MLVGTRTTTNHQLLPLERSRGRHLFHRGKGGGLSLICLTRAKRATVPGRFHSGSIENLCPIHLILNSKFRRYLNSPCCPISSLPVMPYPCRLYLLLSPSISTSSLSAFLPSGSHHIDGVHSGSVSGHAAASRPGGRGIYPLPHLQKAYPSAIAPRPRETIQEKKMVALLGR
jgi:hypothetical protein